ncbi:MAG: lysophospholipase [Planctomycetaceae bacterium]|nr:lysophospholipase [Planctomycetaceae bacterium]
MFARFDFVTWDRTVLSAGVWQSLPHDSLRPVVLVHGMGEHLLRYREIAAALAEWGYAVHSFDLRGHGQSPGRRGDAPGFHYHVLDVLAFIEHVSETHSAANGRIAVAAHSMGGLIALEAALAEPNRITSLFLISPYFRPAFQPQPWRLLAAKLLHGVWPSISLNVGLRLDQFARDRAVQSAIRDDSVSHQKMSARMALQLLERGERRLRSSEPLDVVCRILHGDCDTINSAAASQEFANGQPNVELIRLSDGHHQLHNDSHTRPEVLRHWRELLSSPVPFVARKTNDATG